MFSIMWPDFYEMRKCPFSAKKEIIGPNNKNSESQEFFFGNLKTGSEVSDPKISANFGAKVHRSKCSLI